LQKVNTDLSGGNRKEKDKLKDIFKDKNENTQKKKRGKFNSKILLSKAGFKIE
jgi:hypothetical protein